MELEEEHKQDGCETVYNTNDLRVPLWGKDCGIYQKARLTGNKALLCVCVTKKSHLRAKLRVFISEHEVTLREE